VASGAVSASTVRGLVADVVAEPAA